MKRGYDQFNGVDNEANKAKIQHQTLLQEYLLLQKEYVARKNKLLSSKHKREVLVAEVKFLRRRHKYLMKRHSMEIEAEKDVRKLDPERQMVQGERSNSVSDAALHKNLNMVKIDEKVERGGRKLNIASMPKIYSIDELHNKTKRE